MKLRQIYPISAPPCEEPHHHHCHHEDEHPHWHPATPPRRPAKLDIDCSTDRKELDFDMRQDDDLNLEVYIDDELDVFFKDYIINNPFNPSFYTTEQEDVFNFVLALSKFPDIKFKDGDYLVVSNQRKTQFSVYIFANGEWISFRGKNAFDNEAGDVDLIFDDEDD